MIETPADSQNKQVQPHAAPVVKLCVECGDEFSPPSKGPGQKKKFCADKCRLAFANREKAQGATLISIAMIWRRKRGSGPVAKAAFAELNSILDRHIDRARIDGRLDRLESYVGDLLSEGSYIDRMEENRLGPEFMKRKREAKAAKVSPQP